MNFDDLRARPRTQQHPRDHLVLFCLLTDWAGDTGDTVGAQAVNNLPGARQVDCAVKEDIVNGKDGGGTRARILDIARELMAKQGYAGTSIAHIA
ncbi:hypothetical protein ABZY09_47975, partial [Streptomyces sp. NPDC002928]|uniref:TetR/AcrR family transcriptional regulator n=1 Tax=Streptomyces sp. NPDC002928 TaxID=3154440 RepID=UPI0033B542EE